MILDGKDNKNSAITEPGRAGNGEFATDGAAPETAASVASTPEGATTAAVVEAAGGAVVGPDGRVLMIFRRGMWDLPKGHREADETMRQCALREVGEECGLDIGKLAINGRTDDTKDENGAVLAVTHHDVVTREGVSAVKRTTWYRMAYTGDEALAKPQTEEDIAALEWVAMDEARRRAETSYATIREVVSKL